MGYNKLLFLLITGILSANLDDYLSQINQDIIDVKFQDASQLFTKALSEYDASAKLYYLGAQLSIKTDDLDQANKYLLKSIELDPKNDKFRNSQQQLSEFKDDLTKARKTFDSGFIDNAIIEYEKLKIKYPQYAIVCYNLGLLYKVVKDYDYAVENYQHAKILNPFEVKYSLAIKAISQIIAKEGDEEYRRHEFGSAINNFEAK